MARTSTPTPAIKESSLNEVVLQSDTNALNQLAAVQRDTEEKVMALATQLGYEGALSVAALEDGIRFYQQRTAEACLELGKRLVLLKEATAHGDFMPRLEALGIEHTAAKRFMAVATKFSNSAPVHLLRAANNQRKLVEMLVLEDAEISELEDGGTVRGLTLDDIDRMSARELRANLREAKLEAAANQTILDKKNSAIDRLERDKKRIEKMPADAVLAELQKEATAIMNDALGCVRGGLRQALIALKNYGDTDSTDNTLFMAGMVGQVQADLNALREEFNLPDLSNAADSALAAEVAQWAGK